MIVYGSSKQGKTSLILRHLKEVDYVKIEYSPQTQPIDIYKSVLRQLKITFIESATENIGSEEAAKISGGFKIKVPFIGDLGIDNELSGKDTSSIQTKHNYVEYNLTLAQDFSELLKIYEVDKYIIRL